MKKIILHVTSEVTPFYKRGGLGDVMGALPKYLTTEDYTNIVISQYYNDQMHGLEGCKHSVFFMSLYGLNYEYHCYYKKMKGVHYYFINLSDHEAFAGLEKPQDGDMPYKGASSFMYYLYYGKAVLSTILNIPLHPDYIFCHDWQTAGVFAFQEELRTLKEEHRFKSVFMIHNYEYQGEIYQDCLPYLPGNVAKEVKAIFKKYKSASMMALGIEKSDYVATVSHGYAEELLKGILPHKGLKYITGRDGGINAFLNGVDYDIWHPESSPYLDVRYSYRSVDKKSCIKKEVYDQCGFERQDIHKPLILMMARLTPQKGIQLLAGHHSDKLKVEGDMKKILKSGARLIIYGNPSGGVDGETHEALTFLNEKFKGQLYYNPDYREDLAHKFLAAADIFLAPSLFEPCGLVQVYAMAFGAIPIVRPVGGLKDTVKCHFKSPLDSTGFYINEFSTDCLSDTVKDVVKVFESDRSTWLEIQQRAMQVDFSWYKMREQYLSFLSELDEPSV